MGCIFDHPKTVLLRKGVNSFEVHHHPADVHGARPMDHILSRIRALLRLRRPVSYSEWLS